MTGPLLPGEIAALTRSAPSPVPSGAVLPCLPPAPRPLLITTQNR